MKVTTKPNVQAEPVTVLGIDLAKNIFALHAVDAAGKTVFKKQLKREQMAEFLVQLPPCLIGMEACASAHFWARKLKGFGHDVKLMAPQFVKPYVKTNKNDCADAEAICEAVARPNMRFVNIKTLEQQTILCLHRVRQGFVKAGAAQGNQIRGLMGEFGVIAPQGLHNLIARVPELIEDATNELPSEVRILIQDLLEHLKALRQQAQDVESKILAWNKQSPDSQRLQSIPGIGPLTASALIATTGDVSQFANSRQFSAWLGLVPRQHSSGGKQNLLGISKRGDCYVRSLLVHGARSALRAANLKRQADPSISGWIHKLAQTKHANVATVALANKNARVAWALLSKAQSFDAQHQARRTSRAVCEASIVEQ
jgi:transposase